MIACQPAWQFPKSKGFPTALRLELDHLLEEHGMGVRDILDRLTLDRIGGEADEVDGMARLEGLADLAHRLEASDARPLAGTRVDHDHRPLGLVDHRALRRHDAHQRIVHRSRQAGSLQDDLVVVDQHGVDRPRRHLRLLIAGLPENVEEDERTLPEIGRVVAGSAEPVVQCPGKGGAKRERRR